MSPGVREPVLKKFESHHWVWAREVQKYSSLGQPKLKILIS